MNYRNTALSEFNRLAEEMVNYEEAGEKKTFSIGQVILAIIKNKPEGINCNEWLMNVSDEDMYTKIEETRLKERP